MYNHIVELYSGELYHLETPYKYIRVNNRMAMLYYIEQFSQLSRYDIKEIRKPLSPIELTHCSLVITVTKEMVKSFNQA